MYGADTLVALGEYNQTGLWRHLHRALKARRDIGSTCKTKKGPFHKGNKPMRLCSPVEYSEDM